MLLGGCGQFIEGLVPREWDDVIVAAPRGDEIIVDARTAEEYATGHIPGAANVHWTELTGMDREGLWDVLPPTDLATLLAARGLSSDEPILIYGSGPEGYGDDGNVYWTLRYLGHPEVRVLDGGWAGWLATGGASSTRNDAPPPQEDFFIEPMDTALATTEEVEMQDGVLLDVRSEEEWRDGHLPGAVWMQWTDVFDAGGILKSKRALQERFRELDIEEDTAVIVYCAAGIRAGHTYMVPSLTKAAIAAGADGVIVEVHPDPENAKSDGYQTLSCDAFAEMMAQCRKIADAVGRSL